MIIFRFTATTPPVPLFDRGYTLHEHLEAFKLINMNGRMYDPVIARFLSPDPIIQFPENSQSYNSYSYVLNNPLKYTDPSGFALDWFKNEITGDVYYNSTYKEGDENKIGGDGWTYLGKNGMFSDNTVAKAPVLSDLEVLFKNQTPIVRHFSESGNGAFTVEAVLRGKNASGFMSGQKFELKPLEYKYHMDISRDIHPVDGNFHPESPHDNSRIEKTITVQYVHESQHLNNTTILGDYGAFPYDRDTWMSSPAYTIREQTWTIRKDHYGVYPYKKTSVKSLNWLDSNFPGWRDFYKDFAEKLILRKK